MRKDNNMINSRNKSFRVGISGGTFDPIHIGHLIIAQEVKEAFKLDKVFFIPVGNPPHKDIKNVTSPELRLQMLNAAIGDNNDFEVSDMEIVRNGITFAVDTLKELHEKYKNTKFYYIIGADVVFDLLSWRDYKTVFSLCEFVSVLRPQYDMNKYKERIEWLKESYGAVIHSLETPLMDVSSRNLRERMKNGCSIKYFVTESVEKFILEKGLYR